MGKAKTSPWKIQIQILASPQLPDVEEAEEGLLHPCRLLIILQLGPQLSSWSENTPREPLYTNISKDIPSKNSQTSIT